MPRTSARAGARDRASDERLLKRGPQKQTKPITGTAPEHLAAPDRAGVRSSDMLALQHRLGNRAVQRLLAGPPRPTIQREFVTKTDRGPGELAKYVVNFSDYTPRQVPGVGLSPPQRRKKAIANQFHWIGGVLADPAAYQASLMRLDQLVQERKAGLALAAQPTEALELVLAERETALGLRAAPKATLSGFVHAEDFARLIRSGAVFKDVGAGALHGEFTHRIQWFIIADQWAAQNKAAELAAENPAVRLLDIYQASGDTSFFSGTELAADPATQQKTPWDFIVDAQQDLYETVQGGMASQPERLNAALTRGGDDAGATQMALEEARLIRPDDNWDKPGLPEALRQRRNKREAEMTGKGAKEAADDYQAKKQLTYPNLTPTGQKVVLPGVEEQQDNPIFYKTPEEFEASTFNNP